MHSQGFFAFIGFILFLSALLSGEILSALQVALSFFLLSSIFIIPYLIAKNCSNFVVTNKRVISKIGLFRRITDELSLSKVESVKVDQGIIGRIFNFGTVSIIGTGGSRAVMKPIVSPVEFRKIVQEALD